MFQNIVRGYAKQSRQIKCLLKAYPEHSDSNAGGKTLQPHIVEVYGRGLLNLVAIAADFALLVAVEFPHREIDGNGTVGYD